MLLTAVLLGRSVHQHTTSCVAFRQWMHCSSGDLKRYGRVLFSTASSSILADQIRQSYKERETDGVLDFALSSSLMSNRDIGIHETLVPSVLEAGEGQNKGTVASMMNAMIGSCCRLATDSGTLQREEDRAWISGRVENLVIAYEEMEKTMGIAPDIVSYSLAYTALKNDPGMQDFASNVLEAALKQSKKQAGSKRRKTLASLRPKNTSTFLEAEPTLKQLLGSGFEVLLENNDLAVINKPSGTPCFHRRSTTAGRTKKLKRNDKSDTDSPSDISLEAALISCNVPLSTLNPDALGVVHRLDRGSSGCLVLAKTDDMHARLISEFFLRRTTKTYVALLQETPQSSMLEEGIIDRPVHGRPAKSKYKVLERNVSSSGVSLVEFEIFTGRKHQIRVHAAEDLCSPVLNDSLHGFDRQSRDNAGGKKQEGTPESFFLHARHLVIPQLDIDVEAPMPSSWQDKF